MTLNCNLVEATPLKWPGSKWSYADWICSFIPPHKFYVEPFFGSGAVYFRKRPAPYETINDLDGQVVNFFRVVREHPDELARAIYLTPFSRQEFSSIQEDSAGQEIHLTGNPVEDARRFAVRCGQGFGSKMADRVGWKNTKHANGPNNPRVWGNIPDMVILAAQRLRKTQIEQTDAVGLIRACNSPDCLIYADPPYMTGTRRSRIYRMEMMGEAEHQALLAALLEHEGPVILSGYDNDLYNDILAGWHKEQKQGRSNSAAIRTETLWMNFETNQMQLLESI